MLHVEQLGLFGEPTACARPIPPAVTPARAAPEPPVDALAVAAHHLRGLLADGAWHPMNEVLRVVGRDAFYRVSTWGGSPRPPDAHQVPVALRGDGDGGCWYAAWPGRAA